jgi:tetratricopeptide (TPR) repeat protein
MSKLTPQIKQQLSTILKHYDDRQYKKGLRACDALLKKYPNLGDAMAMKALILNSQGSEKREEAYRLARKAVRVDITSHLCWHILGLIYRSERNYREAAKCLKIAVIHDKENQTVLRDLAVCQAQLREWDGYMQTRHRLVDLKPNIKANWMAFALGAHLKGDYALAVRILDTYEQHFMEGDDEFDASEVIMYKNMVLEEMGDYKRALSHLEQFKTKVVDRLSWKEKRAEMLLKIGNLSDAEAQYRELIKGNPENLKYFKGLEASLNLTPSQGQKLTQEQLDGLIKLYDQLAKEYPKSLAVKQIPFNFLTGEAFRQKVSDYVKPKLTKGEPSLFNTLKYLYNDAEKVKIIEDIFLKFETNLTKSGHFEENENGLEEPTQTILWVWMFLAQHYNKLNNVQRALEYIDKAIKHTPTVIDLYVIKGCIYQTAGNPFLASQLLEQAREMDLADRYLNTKSVRFLMRANKIQEAEKIISPFAKLDLDQWNNIYDLQVMWYEQEEGDSWFRQGNFGKALKKYTWIEKHFQEISDDQYDYHTYCLRKTTLRAYVQMLRFEDRLWGHKYFFKACCAIIETYLHLYDNPPQTMDEFAGLSEEERKRALAKRRKQERKQQRELEQKAQPEKAKNQQNKGLRKRNIKPDPDPDGKQLVEMPPLKEAHKYLQKLLQYSPHELKTHLLAFEVYFRMKKYLLALRAVKKATVLNSQHPDVHRAKTKLFSIVDIINGVVKDVFSQEMPSVFDHCNSPADLRAYNNEYLKQNIDNYAKRVAAAEMKLLLDPNAKLEVLSLLTSITADTNTTIQDCIRAHKFILKAFGSEEAEKYRVQCLQLFPYAVYFGSKAGLEQPKKMSDNDTERKADHNVDTTQQ